jgi:Flp pilus assembly protein TadD
MSFAIHCAVGRRAAKFLAAAALTIVFVAGASAEDKTIHLRFPKGNKPTPVQKLNRDGVHAIQKHDYDRASQLFYEAYLLDPDDPFTLNNLGFISELRGEVDQAARFYDLAQQHASDAAVDISNSPLAEGQPLSKVAGNAPETAMQVNHLNLAAVSLLGKDRAPEADLALQKALTLDPHNPFSLNNMGYTKEKEGELEAAMSFYTAAASRNSREPVVVSANKEWRGQPISEIAARNAKKLRKQLERQQSPAVRLARLNLQGVSAMNRNERAAARKFFEEAYKLDPGDAFTLNNMGYLSELDGDRETANYFYAKARDARGSDSTVTVATRADAEGKKVETVAKGSSKAVNERMEAERQARQRQGAPEFKQRPQPIPPTDSAPNNTQPQR